MGVGGQCHAPAAFTPGKDPVPIVQEAGWAPGPVWIGAENLAPPPGFNPWTFQPVVSCYTDNAIPALCRLVLFILKDNPTQQLSCHKQEDLDTQCVLSFSVPNVKCSVNTCG